jgi:ATP:ADP antiporter, AAA family
MMVALQRLLRLEPGEGRRVAQFATLGLLLQAGLSFGSAAADSLFLVNVGADKLPHIYLIMPAIMVGYIPTYSYLLSRWGIERVFDLTLGLLVTGGIGLWALFQQAGDTSPIWLCYAAKLYSSLWYVGTYSLFWNFIDNYFDLRDAKRLFALFAAGSAVGAIIAGGLVAPLSSAYGVSPLFLIWAMMAGLCWPLGVWTRQTTIAYDAEADSSDEGGGAAKSIQAIGHLFRSPYAVILTLLLFATLITATICEYQYLGVFSEGLEEAELAGLLGRLTAIVNVLNLGITLFFFNRLVARLGVPNVAFIQPIAYTLVFTWLLLDRGFLSAAGGFLAYQGIMTAIDYNNVNLLFSGLPAKSRKQIRTFIEGIGEPLATATAGVFLFFIGGNLDPADLSIGGALAALTCLALVFALRARYSSAIAANLKREWLDFSRATFAPSPVVTTRPDLPPTTPTPAVPDALTEIRSGRAKPYLLPELLEDPDAQVRRLALAAAHNLDRTALQTEDTLLPTLLRQLPTAASSDRILILDTIERISDSGSVRNLLRIAHLFQPAERRRLVQLILAFGPRTVPHLTAIAQSPSSSVDARCIALTIIGKLAPAQADGLAQQLITTTLKRAYLFLGSYLALTRDHPTDSGRVVLMQVYRDFPTLAVQVVLETLSVTGRLAGPEATLAALRSGTPKDRSYAIETVEQSCDRSVFNLLLPLIDGRSLEAQIAYGTAAGLLPELTSAQVLAQAAGSNFPLQASAVAQANYQPFGTVRPDALLETLRACPHPMVHRTVMSLLDPDSLAPTPVDVAHSIMQAAPLRGALFVHHEMLVEHAVVIEATHDQELFAAGTPSDGLWHIMTGSVRWSDSTPPASPGDTLGQEELHTGLPYQRGATALAGSLIVHLPQAVLENTVRIHPTFGLVLLRQKLRA